MDEFNLHIGVCISCEPFILSLKETHEPIYNQTWLSDLIKWFEGPCEPFILSLKETYGLIYNQTWLSDLIKWFEGLYFRYS